MKEDTLNEKELINLAKQGGEVSKDAIGKLYELYHRYVEDEARKCLYKNEDLDEFCQEVWKRVIKSIPSYRGDTLKGLLGRAYAGTGKPSGIIGNYYLEFIRKKTSILQSAEELDYLSRTKPKKIHLISIETPVGEDDEGNTLLLKDVIPDESKSPLEILIEKETQQIVREEVEKLPNIYRYVILMRYFDGRPVKEISELLNIKEDDIYWRLSEAYEKLKVQLIKRMGENPLEEVNIYRSKKHNRRK